MSNPLPEHEGFTFVHETFIEIPFHRTVRVDSEGNHEVTHERVPGCNDIAAPACRAWDLAGAIQQRAIDQQTAEEVARQIAQRKADRAIARAEEESL